MDIQTSSSNGTAPDEANRLSPSTAFAILADECRRQTLAELVETTVPLDEEALATAVAARTGREDSAEVTTEQARTVAVELQHVHLPKLQESGLVERDADASRIEDVSPDCVDGLVADVLERRDGVDAALLDRLCAILSTPRNRRVLATLRDAADPLTLDNLTRALAHRDPGTVTKTDIDRLRMQLHHVVLPKLRDAGLIEATSTDSESSYSYSYSGHPFLRPDWL